MVRKLMRSQTDRLVAGVCAGIAEFFGISPFIVRVLFVFTPGSLLIYIILAVYLEKNPSLY